MDKEKKKLWVRRVYSINQKKVDEALLEFFDSMILEVASKEALKEMLRKIQKKLPKEKRPFSVGAV